MATTRSLTWTASEAIEESGGCYGVTLAIDALESKCLRLTGGGTPRVLDLFSGAGGMSLGFLAAGYEILGGVENDPWAAQSYALNFHGESEQSLLLHRQPRDITAQEPDALLRELRPMDEPGGVVDAVIGGPPCQAFARVGRAKLREIASTPDAYKRDERAKLYTSFLHYIDILKPVMVVMENVPDILNYGGHNIAEEICETLTDAGYECRYTLLNAVHYGVPQMRERFLLIAIAKIAGITPSFPAPTHYHRLPPGYEGSRQVALKTIGTSGQRSFLSDGFMSKPPMAERCLPSAVTVAEALNDLPPITLHLEGMLKRGARRFDELAKYRAGVGPSAYATSMRTWPGFENAEGVYDHVIRSLPRDYPIFRRMRPGDQYPEAHRHAIDLFRERVEELRAAGEDIPEGFKRYLDLYDEMVPPYDPGKFPNKWRKLESDQPSRTLLAHLGKDSYTHIHYDDTQARTISVREAARLQSFPDGFRFAGTMNPAFRQIGNAVPPLLAKAVASHLLEQMRNESCLTERPKMESLLVPA